MRLKEKEKKQRKLIQELDVELLAWKEKHKYSDERCRDLQAKFETTSREVTYLKHENEKLALMNAIHEK